MYVNVYNFKSKGGKGDLRSDSKYSLEYMCDPDLSRGSSSPRVLSSPLVLQGRMRVKCKKVGAHSIG